LEIDESRNEIVVEPSRGGRVPYFKGTSGADIHPEVRQRMRDLLAAETVPRYLDPIARNMLIAARSTIRAMHALEHPFVSDGSNLIWFTWTGSRINRTLMALGSFIAGLKVTDDEIALTFENSSEKEVRDAFQRLLKLQTSAEELAAKLIIKVREKYDWCLSEELQIKVLAQNSLDMEGALALVRRYLSCVELIE
jgi:ATP-dependent Lhr-like helicase